MTKAKSKPKTTTRKPVREARRSKSRKRLPSTPVSTESRPDTKHVRIIAMLRAPAGATIAVIMTATGWQQHSVRGFLAGIVRKKLGLNLVSEPGEGGRVYRIIDETASTAKADRVKQAA